MPVFRSLYLALRRLAWLGLILALLWGLTATPPVSAQDTSVTHIVRRGENLYLIAARYGVTVYDIMRANRLRNPNMIYVGQELVIPVAGQTTTTTAQTPSPTPEQVVHIVRPGQTLYWIAQHYGVTVGEIMRANHLRNPHLIYVGQRLIIPSVPAPTAVPPTARAPTATFTPTMQPFVIEATATPCPQLWRP
ncbi:MAG: LysM peptidoglycan-binding domain-containing protein, partial [Anaerolineae bacterium]|nr:LysM peptidoglycan-binding domain-containing protein [Anaerolineae bacterium]